MLIRGIFHHITIHRFQSEVASGNQEMSKQLTNLSCKFSLWGDPCRREWAKSSLIFYPLLPFRCHEGSLCDGRGILDRLQVHHRNTLSLATRDNLDLPVCLMLMFLDSGTTITYLRSSPLVVEAGFSCFVWFSPNIAACVTDKQPLFLSKTHCSRSSAVCSD